MSALSCRGSPCARGIVAVELAVMLPFLVMLLVLPLYFGRVFWHYTAIQHAAQDAARYLSKAPVSEMGNPTRAIAVASVADAIIARELAELAPGGFPYVADVTCDGGSCVGYSRPANVGVIIQVLMENSFFPGYMSMTIPLTVSVTYPYMGR